MTGLDSRPMSTPVSHLDVSPMGIHPTAVDDGALDATGRESVMSGVLATQRVTSSRLAFGGELPHVASAELVAGDPMPTVASAELVVDEVPKKEFRISVCSAGGGPSATVTAKEQEKIDQIQTIYERCKGEIKNYLAETRRLSRAQVEQLDIHLDLTHNQILWEVGEPTGNPERLALEDIANERLRQGLQTDFAQASKMVGKIREMPGHSDVAQYNSGYMGESNGTHLLHQLDIITRSRMNGPFGDFASKNLDRVLGVHKGDLETNQYALRRMMKAEMYRQDMIGTIQKILARKQGELQTQFEDKGIRNGRSVELQHDIAILEKRLNHFAHADMYAVNTVLAHDEMECSEARANSEGKAPSIVQAGRVRDGVLAHLDAAGVGKKKWTMFSPSSWCSDRILSDGQKHYAKFVGALACKERIEVTTFLDRNGIAGRASLGVEGGYILRNVNRGACDPMYGMDMFDSLVDKGAVAELQAQMNASDTQMSGSMIGVEGLFVHDQDYEVSKLRKNCIAFMKSRQPATVARGRGGTGSSLSGASTSGSTPSPTLHGVRPGSRDSSDQMGFRSITPNIAAEFGSQRVVPVVTPKPVRARSPSVSPEDTL